MNKTKENQIPILNYIKYSNLVCVYLLRGTRSSQRQCSLTSNIIQNLGCQPRRLLCHHFHLLLRWLLLCQTLHYIIQAAEENTIAKGGGEIIWWWL